MLEGTGEKIFSFELWANLLTLLFKGSLDSKSNFHYKVSFHNIACYIFSIFIKVGFFGSRDSLTMTRNA